MRKITAAIAFTLSLTTFSANAVYVRGYASCGQWVAARQSKSVASYQNQAWLLGYLSGIAVGTGNEILNSTDPESLYLWVDNYCRANPLKDVSDAGVQLSLELAAKKGS